MLATILGNRRGNLPEREDTARAAGTTILTWWSVYPRLNSQFQWLVRMFFLWSGLLKRSAL